jgi:hypothetical protein
LANLKGTGYFEELVMDGRIMYIMNLKGAAGKGVYWIIAARA